METVYQILGIIGASLIVWLLYRSIKGNPTAFSKEKMQSSFYSMGVLALVLIAFIAFLVFLLRVS